MEMQIYRWVLSLQLLLSIINKHVDELHSFLWKDDTAYISSKRLWHLNIIPDK